ncbi:MAG: hypothetical protein A6F71_05020 [Cycloclasticus sp. symbiont of Poecilosclerida sp. M]|nr:MAG: hypothetical protein A6F71_05020 [Cycloclasticus sp. symbiont of Poecilosclerida sp. M]
MTQETQKMRLLFMTIPYQIMVIIIIMHKRPGEAMALFYALQDSGSLSEHEKFGSQIPFQCGRQPSLEATPLSRLHHHRPQV